MLDYSAFDEKNILKLNGKLPGTTRTASPIAAVFIIILLSILPLLFLLIIFPPIVSAVVFIVLIFFLIFIYKSSKANRFSDIKTALFAKRNNFEYSQLGGKLQPTIGLGSILGEPMISNEVSGSFLGCKFIFGGTYGRGFYNVMLVELKNNYPHILLDAKSNNFVISNLLEHIPDSREIVLEGDFPKYFRVYSATTPVNTLQILSPDLMSRMIDYTQRADIEIVGNKLLLVCNFRALTKSVCQMMFEAAGQILNDIGENSNNSKVKFNS